MRRLTARLALTLLLVTVGAQAAQRAPESGWQLVTLGLPGASYRMAFLSNRDLSGDLSAITTVISIQHGINRNGDAYFATAAKLASELARSRDDILVLAPQFFAIDDALRTDLSNVPRWTSEGWIEGDDARGISVSSLEAYDHLLGWFADKRRFPALKRVVLAGHSAGAQLVQRYAALNRMDEKLREAGLSVRYVIANPSTYLYFTNERPTPSGFAAYDPAACPSYNDYKYGFAKPVRYAASIDPRIAFVRYATRDVVYLFGGNDNDPNHSLLDKRCAANAQGPHRLERGINYVRYERYVAGDRVRLAHRAYEVSGVGHNHRGMLRSTCGVRALFDLEAAPVKARPCREIP